MRTTIVAALILATSQVSCGNSRTTRLARLEAAGLGIDVLVREASAWVRSERGRHRPLARPLTLEERRRLEPYFESEVLQIVRVRAVRALQNPDFFNRFTGAGEAPPRRM
ncbi:MAG: hypothetical protein GY719_34040 [bacterium]|nr:hypothetical protein [bacterium]